MLSIEKGKQRGETFGKVQLRNVNNDHERNMNRVKFCCCCCRFHESIIERVS